MSKLNKPNFVRAIDTIGSLINQVDDLRQSAEAVLNDLYDLDDEVTDLESLSDIDDDEALDAGLGVELDSPRHIRGHDIREELRELARFEAFSFANLDQETKREAFYHLVDAVDALQELVEQGAALKA